MITETQPRFTRGLPVGGTADRSAVELGRLYQRAAKELGAKELRGFLLHQAEWLIHLRVLDETARLDYVAQTREYLRRLLALTAKPRRRNNVKAFRPEVVDD